MNKNTNKKLYLTIVSVLALLLSIFLFLYILYKQNYFSFGRKASPAISVPARPVNTVKYTNATKNEQLTNAQKTQDMNTTPSATVISKNISIVLNAAGQDVPGGPINIAAKISGVTSGQCSIILTNTNSSKNYSSSINWGGSFYNCLYSIPYSDVSSGLWSLTLSINQENSSGSVKKDIIVR